MALSWTQDRLGPICRYAEDTALVMQAIARPDGRDMSVTDLAFNWDAEFDVRKLRVGILQDSFDEITNAAAKANAEKTLATLKSIGIRELIPVTVPEAVSNVSAISVESTAFFDEHARAGRMQGTRSARPNGRLVPAVDWLQSQRVRMMMMMELAKATAHVDVYLVGSNNTGTGGPGGPPAAPGIEGGTPRPPEPPRPQTPTQRHFAMANLAGYPALNLPNGFAEAGTPTNATIYAQPYRELHIIALARAYQDAARHHLVTPRLDT
jgi:Asp-tRNA(Asn)/Glu-tRNA(Gln) amidotransferase A subunit family amidase